MSDPIRYIVNEVSRITGTTDWYGNLVLGGVTAIGGLLVFIVILSVVLARRER